MRRNNHDNSITQRHIWIIVFLLISPLEATWSDCFDVCDDAVDMLFDRHGSAMATEEDFFRLLLPAFGLAGNYDGTLPWDTVVARLTTRQIIEQDIDINRCEPLTRGKASTVLVNALFPDKGSFLEKLMIGLFNMERAYVRVALREKIIPQGAGGDTLVIKELAAIVVATTAMTSSDPPADADTKCIDRLTVAIVERVISLEEIEKILGLEDSRNIRAILAM